MAECSIDCQGICSSHALATLGRKSGTTSFKILRIGNTGEPGTCVKEIEEVQEIRARIQLRMGTATQWQQMKRRESCTSSKVAAKCLSFSSKSILHPFQTPQQINHGYGKIDYKIIPRGKKIGLI
ncbi:hypothetical protein SLEP1_g26994 [Rubroshorea leprosula]|uniref:Ribosomal protein S13 n=1 Tax=Rubroshorea leprosula TaxID=152421 RepID=A0AAV5JXL5_9ROSI|nr:hypothetical protein SLEP1_g26994 [Rubroshorea leprosula]